MTHLPVLHGPCMLAGNDPSGMYAKKWSFVRHEWKASWTARTKPEERHIASMQLHSTTIFFNKFNVFEMDVQSDQVRLNREPVNGF